MGVRETMCSKCIHLGVCKYKEDYLNTVEVLETSTVYVQGEYKTVRENEIFRFVDPICIHFSQSKTAVTLISKEDRNGTPV